MEATGSGGSWVERYRPKDIRHVAGQKAATDEMMRWASSWSDGRVPEKRALILDGEPGTGKTTAALALANLMGWQAIELNASDTRNQEAIRRMATRGSQSTSITDDSYGGGGKPSRKLIILDEADSLYEGAASDDGQDLSDKGGKKAIVELVRTTLQPVILIVNDLYSLTKGSGSPLPFMCIKIKFKRLLPRTVMNRLRDICEMEGIRADETVLEALANRSGGDLRAAIGDLQMISCGRSFISLKDMDVLGDRDTKDNIFNVLGNMFAAGSIEDSKRSMSKLDEDPETLMLWVAQNVPVSFPEPSSLDRAMELVSRADTYIGRVRRRQNYRLWRYSSDMMAAIFTAGKGGRQRGAFAFPVYLKEMSRTKESRSVLKELSQKLGSFTHTSSRDIKENGQYPISTLMLRDEELAMNIVADTGLSKESVEYLLGSKIAKKEIQKIMDGAAKLLKERSKPVKLNGGLAGFDEADDPASEEGGKDKDMDGPMDGYEGDDGSGPTEEAPSTGSNAQGQKAAQTKLFDF